MSSTPALLEPSRPGPPARRGRPVLPPGPAQAHRHGHRPRRGRPPPSSRRTRRLTAHHRGSARSTQAPPRAKRPPSTASPAPSAAPSRWPASSPSLPARRPSPKLRLNECPNARRPDRAETDAPDAEPWAEPCERPEGADCDADEDLDDDLDEQSFAELIASLRHDTGLAHLTDAELRQHRTPSSAQATAQEGVPSERGNLCARAAVTKTAQPRAAQPRPGTGPPAP